MPDVEKLFVQQHPPEQSASISAAFQAVSLDISSSIATAVVAATVSPVTANVRHCPAVPKLLDNCAHSIEEATGENQIASSHPLSTDSAPDVHSASPNCQGPAGTSSAGEKEEAQLTSSATDRTFTIDSRMLLTLLAEDGKAENGDASQEQRAISDENAAVSAEPPSTTTRFGSGHCKHIHQASNGSSSGCHLATVLENLPLPLESSIQNSDQNNMRSSSPITGDSPDCENPSGTIGHSRSAHSFGPADSLGVAYSAQQQQKTENRRTHARHSSYEVPTSAQQRPNNIFNGQNISACLNSILAPSTTSGFTGSCLAPFGRTNSLSRTGTDASSFSSSFSISSLSYSDYSASLASINDSNGGECQPHFFHQQQHDENSSKRSSLDRRSLTSYCSSSSNDDGGCSGAGFGQRINDIVAGTTAAGGDSNGITGNHKRLLPLANILPRGLFSRKTLNITPSNGPAINEHAVVNSGRQSQSGTSWKLPFRPPAALASTLGSALSLSLSSTSLSANHPGGKSHNVNKELAAEAPSTTALILQDRPATLPPKSAGEEERHRRLYEQMIEVVKKKEQREAKQRKKQQRLQLKQEEMLSAAVKEWTTEILPRWDEVKHTKRVRELWGQGLPPCVRGKVWKLAIGNELSITEELFEICVNRAKERLRQFEEGSSANDRGSSPNGNSQTSSHTLFNTPPTSPSSTTTMATAAESPVDREGTVELIHLDVARTFPVLGIFQKGGPYYDLLLNVLGAYACYRPDVGYVQGMSFLAAVLLLNMDAPDTFIVFANLMNRPCQLAFFRLRQAEMERYFLAYDRYFHECLPNLYAHFKQLDVRPNLYLIEWLYTLYAKSLPLEVTCRIWDTFVRDGEEFLFRTAVGILHQYEDVLLRTDFDRCVQFLTHLPDNVRASELFRSIDEAAPMASSAYSFCSASVRHSTCGGGSGGEKRRFMHFFNELGDKSSSSTTSGCSSPTCGNGAIHHNPPSILFTYAANFLSSNQIAPSSSPRSSASLPSSRRESAVHKNNLSDESESECRQETKADPKSESEVVEENIVVQESGQPEVNKGESDHCGAVCRL